MLVLPIYRGCGRLLVALALTALTLLASVATGRMARAQDVSLPIGEPNMPLQRDFDNAEAERLFREYQRLTRAQAQTGPVMPRTDWTKRPRGDFWTPGDLERLFRR